MGLGIVSGYAQPNYAAIARATARRSCVACKNYHAIHPRTKGSYCEDGAKEVFVDSGCSKWKLVTNT